MDLTVQEPRQFGDIRAAIRRASVFGEQLRDTDL
jgi:hypothetical protein